MKLPMLLCILTILFFTSLSCDNTNNSSSIVLNAEVEYYGNYFTVKNKNYFNWYNVSYYLNYKGDDITFGYILNDRIHHSKIEAHDTAFISDVEFRNLEGWQFHRTLPLEAPVKLLIKAENHDGKQGTYLKTWEPVSVTP